MFLSSDDATEVKCLVQVTWCTVVELFVMQCLSVYLLLVGVLYCKTVKLFAYPSQQKHPRTSNIYTQRSTSISHVQPCHKARSQATIHSRPSNWFAHSHTLDFIRADTARRAVGLCRAVLEINILLCAARDDTAETLAPLRGTRW